MTYLTTRKAFGLVAFTAAIMLAGTALADDWAVTKLRGTVLQLVDGQWAKLGRGDVVPDARPIRSLRNARVTFVRGAETIEVGPDTQIQIHDEAGKKPFTTVQEYFGTVSIEAEVKQVQHFAVQTPYLAAVVKGTRFTVSSDDKGAEVEVERGHVAVEDRREHHSVTISAGQAASSGTTQSLEVSGSGVLPVVLDATNKPVDPVAAAVQQKLAEIDTSNLTPAQIKTLEQEAKKEAEADAKVTKEAEKAAEKADKDAAKQAEKAEKADKEAEKGDKKSEKSEKSGKSESSSSGSDKGNSGKGSSGSSNSGSSGSSGSGSSSSGSSDDDNGDSGNSGSGKGGGKGKK